jgi:hypothetical protein
MSLKILVDAYYKKKYEEDIRIINIENIIKENYKNKTEYEFKIQLDTSKGGDFHCYYHNDMKFIMKDIINLCEENDFYLKFSIVYIENKNYYIDVFINIIKNYENIYL